MKPGRTIDSLLAVMAALRTPGTGCNWDLEQSFETIAPYTIEEAYEVADAIERSDLDDLREELGDLLLQVVFHARIAEEAGHFAFADVVEAINAKMIRRHPHVFGTRKDWTPAEVKASWKRIKAEEKAERAVARIAAGKSEDASGLLGSISPAMPPMARAVKLQAAAGTVGFDWNDPKAVLAKMREELDEIEEALDGGEKARVESEIGDMLFAVANLARHLGIDPDAAVASTNTKFMRRFAHIERALAAQERTLTDSTLEEMDALWNEAKRSEKR